MAFQQLNQYEQDRQSRELQERQVREQQLKMEEEKRRQEEVISQLSSTSCLFFLSLFFLLHRCIFYPNTILGAASPKSYRRSPLQRSRGDHQRRVRLGPNCGSRF